MRLPKFAIDNASFTWMLFIFLLFLGVNALVTMPKTENPEMAIPGTSILIVMPGASPMDLENLVVLPIEEALNELDDINRVGTTVRDGYASVSVEFDFSANADDKYDEVVRQFNSIRNDLPDEIAYSEVWQWSTTDITMMQLALISDSASFRELKMHGEILKKELERIKSVMKVGFLALPEQEIHIDLDMQKMGRVNTTIEMVSRALVSNNTTIPGGDVTIGSSNVNIKTSGSYVSLDEMRKTVVNSYQGKIIYLENIADIGYGYENLKYLARYGGDFSDSTRTGSHRAIFMTISQKEGYNVLATARQINPIVEDMRESLPPGIDLEVVFNQPKKVQARIHTFMTNLIQGIILVGIVIFLSLGIRSSIVVVIAIPLSIIIGLAFIDMSGFGLQQISIAGLIVALGLLVDNSIVMVENIDRYMSLGYKRREASYKAASEIGWPVITATLTTAMAFVPIAAMPDKTGAFIKSLPISISITLGISMLIALTLTPTITSRLYREAKGDPGRVKGTGKLIKWLVEHPFRSSLQFSLKRPWLVILFALVALAGSGYMFQFVGVSFFPKAEQPNLMIKATLPENSSLSRTDEVARSIELILDTVPEVKYYATNVGHGNPRIYYNIFPKRFDMKFADIYVETYAYDPETFPGFLERLRSAFSELPDAKISVKEFEQGPPFEAPIQVYITGEELEVLRNISEDVENIIAAQPGVINLENLFVKTNTELLFDINRDKANMFGVPIMEIDRTIRTAFEGIEISAYRDETGSEFKIILKTSDPEAFEASDLDKVYVASLSGQQIPLKQLVTPRFQQGSSLISRYNFERTAEILADVRQGYMLDEVMEPVIDSLQNYPFPAGYGFTIGGELQSREESFAGMLNAIIIAIISIFALLVLQFRSFKQPLIIFLAIPFAAIGMIWALYITGHSFSFTAFVGLTSLVGIVVNNSIILVDYTNRLKAEGKPTLEAIQLAAETRLKPIVLTALTTIGGLLPLTLRGGTLWAPMGWTIIGGLLVSTLLTLIVVPVFYKILERK